MGLKITSSGQTIVSPRPLVWSQTQTLILIYGLFQKGQVLAQDRVLRPTPARFSYDALRKTKRLFSPNWNLRNSTSVSPCDEKIAGVSLGSKP